MTADFNRATISELDFIEAEAYLTYLVEFQNASSDTVRKALLVAAIIAYGRPFTNNEIGKSPTASPKITLLNDHLLTDQQQTMHKYLMELRNKAIAHSEHSKNPVTLGSVQESAISFKAEPFEILKERISYNEFLALCQKRKSQAISTGFVAAHSPASERDAL